MENFPENQDINAENEESTVFSAPSEHSDEKLKSPKKRKIMAAVAALLSVLILVGGTVAVIKLIPKREDEDNSSEIQKISVIDFEKEKFDTITVENKNGKFSFYPKAESNDEGSESADTKWYVKDLSEEKISTYKTGEIISAAAKIEAIMEITKKSFEDCGFNEPSVKVSVSSKELGDFYILFGLVSPDNSGIYLYSSLDEKIYLVSLDAADSFDFTDVDLANTDSVPSLADNAELGSYFENGSLTKLDKLTVSGSKFMYPIDIINTQDDLFPYKVISPVKRNADSEKITSLLTPFTSGISVSGVYSLSTDTAAQKAFGLYNADFIVSLTLGKQAFTYKFALQSDGFYAAFGEYL